MSPLRCPACSMEGRRTFLRFGAASATLLSAGLFAPFAGAVALTKAQRDHGRLENARVQQLSRWEQQEASLRQALGIRSVDRADESSDTMAVL